MRECDRIRSRLADYALGALRARESARVEEHVSECEHCRAELRALEKTGELLSAVGKRSAPAGTWDAVRREIEARPGTLPRRAPRFALGTALGAVALLLVMLGAYLLGPLISPAPPEVVVTVEADEEMQAVIEGHLAAVWAAPLADEAAVGLRFAAVEGNGS
jgi:anti-sigma factor RsiW